MQQLKHVFSTGATSVYWLLPMLVAISTTAGAVGLLLQDSARPPIPIATGLADAHVLCGQGVTQVRIDGVLVSCVDLPPPD